MASEDTYGQAGKIAALCVCWYISSSANSIVGKIILSDFPYPMTVSMVQLVSIVVYTTPILYMWSIPSADRIPLRYFCKMILPLALGKFFASVSSHISLWKVPVSYAHTVKATMPLFTVILSRIFLKEKQEWNVYISLIPIVGGVLIATVTELSFDIIGMLSALVATLGFAVQNIFSKKCLKETGVHHFRLLYLLAGISAFCFAPVWFLYDGVTIWRDSGLLHSSHFPRLIGLLLIDGFCNFAQNIVAFTVIALVTPLSYAVANATKRISIITVSLITLKNPVTATNVMGMLTAILGVLLYNKAKFDQSRHRHTLPVIQKPSPGAGPAPNGSLLLPHSATNSLPRPNNIFLSPDSVPSDYSNGFLRTVDSCGNIYGNSLNGKLGKDGVLSVTRWV